LKNKKKGQKNALFSVGSFTLKFFGFLVREKLEKFEELFKILDK